MIYEPKPGDFGVVRTNGWAARLIQVGTASRWNHAFIYIGGGIIAEARPKEGLVLKSVSQYKRIAWNQHQELTQKQRDQIIDKAHSLLGTSYGFIDIFILGLRILGLKFLTGKLLEKMCMAQGIICSEYVAKIFLSENIPFKTVIIETPGNELELSYAYHFCRKNNIEPIILKKTEAEMLKCYDADVKTSLRPRFLDSLLNSFNHDYKALAKFLHDQPLLKAEELRKLVGNWDGNYKNYEKDVYLRLTREIIDYYSKNVQPAFSNYNSILTSMYSDYVREIVRAHV